MLLALWIMSLVAVSAVCIITCHDTYELRRRLRRASTVGHKRILITRVILLWIASLASIAAAVITDIDTQTKEERIGALTARLTPIITKAEHDNFVHMLRDQPKGEVPVFHEQASAATYKLIPQIRHMLTDAGFKTNDSTTPDEINIDVDGADEGETDIFVLVKSKEMPDNPVYTQPLLHAFRAIGIEAEPLLVRDDVKGVDKDHIAVLVINTQ
jgi:hypothetical protein